MAVAAAAKLQDTTSVSVEPPTRKGPLSGIRVVAFTHILAGPFCVANLRDLGAEVMVVESPEGGDATRGYPAFRVANDNGKAKEWTGADGKTKQSLYHAALNSGNKTIQLNLSEYNKDKAGNLVPNQNYAADTKTMHELLASADVFVYNQTGKTMKTLGIDHDTLKGKYPHLIECHISGDMYDEKGGYDLKAMAEGGVLEAIAKVGNTQYAPGLSLADMVAGMEAAKDISAALLRRQKDMEEGKPRSGELIQVSLITAVRNFFRMMFAGVTNKMETGAQEVGDPTGLSAYHPSIAPFATFECGDKKKIVICCGTEPMYKKLVEALGSPKTLLDGKYATNADRVKNKDALGDDIEAVLKEKSSTEWLKVLEDKGIVTALILRPSEVIKGYKEQGTLGNYFREVVEKVTGGIKKTVFLLPQTAWFEKDGGVSNDRIEIASTDPNANGEEIKIGLKAGSYIGPSIETRLMGIGIPFVNDNGTAKKALLTMLKAPAHWAAELKKRTIDEIGKILLNAQGIAA